MEFNIQSFRDPDGYATVRLKDAVSLCEDYLIEFKEEIGTSAVSLSEFLGFFETLSMNAQYDLDNGNSVVHVWEDSL